MDLIDRMIRRLQHIEPQMTAERAEVLEESLRAEFGGIPNKPRKRKKPKQDSVAAAIAERFNGNVDELARQLGCHRATVYRVLSSRKSIRK